MRFEDRTHAGRILAERLGKYANRSDVLVLALPRGGVPVGFEVARELHVPLDVFVVRKLGFPGHEEYAMGAIASGGTRVMNPDVARLQIPERTVEMVVAREAGELARRERLYRGERPLPRLEGRMVILVDDGLATGSTMRAAVMAARARHPAQVVVAVPVAAAETCSALRRDADEVICVSTPQPFHAVGLWYADFRQTTDDEVRQFLDQAARMREQERE